MHHLFEIISEVFVFKIIMFGQIIEKWDLQSCLYCVYLDITSHVYKYFFGRVDVTS